MTTCPRCDCEMDRIRSVADGVQFWCINCELADTKAKLRRCEEALSRIVAVCNASYSSIARFIERIAATVPVDAGEVEG